MHHISIQQLFGQERKNSLVADSGTVLWHYFGEGFEIDFLFWGLQFVEFAKVQKASEHVVVEPRIQLEFIKARSLARHG